MTDARWQEWADEARAQSRDMRDKGYQLVMEGIAKTYEQWAAMDAEVNGQREGLGRLVDGASFGCAGRPRRMPEGTRSNG